MGATAGCGGRIFADSEGGVDAPRAGRAADDPGNDDAGGSTENTAQAADDAGGRDDGAPDLEMEFFICPPAPPAVYAECDPPGQVCAYYGFSSCQSWVCSSVGWQQGGQGC
jgi:hypothetical protein